MTVFLEIQDGNSRYLGMDSGPLYLTPMTIFAYNLVCRNLLVILGSLWVQNSILGNLRWHLPPFTKKHKWYISANSLIFRWFSPNLVCRYIRVAWDPFRKFKMATAAVLKLILDYFNSQWKYLRNWSKTDDNDRITNTLWLKNNDIIPS